jgi:mRNA-degrading endonuclease RelE of RelBE toxin-antitoxin system
MEKSNQTPKKIYDDAIREIKKLKREYNKILEDFIKKLEEYKIQKIKKSIR